MSTELEIQKHGSISIGANELKTLSFVAERRHLNPLDQQEQLAGETEFARTVALHFQAPRLAIEEGVVHFPECTRWSFNLSAPAREVVKVWLQDEALASGLPAEFDRRLEILEKL